MLEDTGGSKKIKENKTLKISRANSYEILDDASLICSKINESKTQKFSRTNSLEIDEDSHKCKNGLDPVVKPLISKPESKSEIKKRLKFLSKIYLKASRSSTCKSCLPKSNFSLRLAAAENLRLEKREMIRCSRCNFSTFQAGETLC